MIVYKLGFTLLISVPIYLLSGLRLPASGLRPKVFGKNKQSHYSSRRIAEFVRG